jgi:hypothetical protein
MLGSSGLTPVRTPFRWSGANPGVAVGGNGVRSRSQDVPVVETGVATSAAEATE